MTQYQILRLDADGGIADCVTMEFPSDGAVINYAFELLNEGSNLELWCGTRFISQLATACPDHRAAPCLSNGRAAALAHAH